MISKKEYREETHVYASDKERIQVAWELLSYAHMLYSRVYVFQNLDAFAESFHDSPPEVYWNAMSHEKLIDQIKICIAFENYNKAKLLMAGYLVHVIDGKKNKKLSSMQKTSPILISQFLSSNNFIQDNPYGELFLDGLANFNTISFSLTLSDQYQSVIGLESRFLNYLKATNPKRNRLHYYKNYAGAFRVETYLDSLRYARQHGTDLLIAELKKSESALKAFE